MDCGVNLQKFGVQDGSGGLELQLHFRQEH
jgi:hypothetical protein